MPLLATFTGATDYGYWQTLSMGDKNDDGQLDIWREGVHSRRVFFQWQRLCNRWKCLCGLQRFGLRQRLRHGFWGVLLQLHVLFARVWAIRTVMASTTFVVASDLLYAVEAITRGAVLGGTSVFGPYKIGDTDVLFTRSSSSQLKHASLSQFDIDGDGLDELSTAISSMRPIAGLSTEWPVSI